MYAVALQVIAAGIVAGVGIAWVAYAIGVDRAVVRAIYVMVPVLRHPLQSFELAVAALILAKLPAPRVSRHRIRREVAA